MKKIKLIAEIGENFQGNINLAKLMISQAKKCGADFAKFQSYNENCLKKNDPEYHWFKKVSLSDQSHKLLKKHSLNKKIRFLSSPFSLERAVFLCEKLKMKKIKVASSKMTDINLLKYLNKKCDEVFFSTGLSNLKEIKNSLKYLSNTKVYIMHCVSEYPLNIKNTNLLAIKTLKKTFPNYEIGYSDHTIGTLACKIAAALGASVIEKHFTLNKNLKGTDHILSATPNEMKDLRKNLDEIILMFGSGKKIPSKKEVKIKKFMRNRFK